MRGHEPNIKHISDWNLDASMPDGAKMTVSQARLLGGGSTIDGSIAIGGSLADSQKWEALANPAWGWKSVFPVYREIEDDTVGKTKTHGRGGPLPVNRHHRQEHGLIRKAFVDAARRDGFRDCHDLNAQDAVGFGSMPMTRVGITWISAAMAYLDPVRYRSNLTVRPDTMGDRLELTKSCNRGAAAGRYRVEHAENSYVCRGHHDPMHSPTVWHRPKSPT